MKQVEVVAAIIQVEDRFLCLQRNAGEYDYISLKYEFPGGKIEPGESLNQALENALANHNGRSASPHRYKGAQLMAPPSNVGDISLVLSK